MRISHFSLSSEGTKVYRMLISHEGTRNNSGYSVLFFPINGYFTVLFCFFTKNICFLLSVLRNTGSLK